MSRGHFRPLLPAVELEAPIDARQTPLSPDPTTAPTRRQVASACLECRKRKVKCTGIRPVCGRCSSQRLECAYDVEPDTTRVVSLKRRHQELETENEDWRELFHSLCSRPEEEAAEIFRRMRQTGDPIAVLNFVRSGDLLLQK